MKRKNITALALTLALGLSMTAAFPVHAAELQAKPAAAEQTTGVAIDDVNFPDEAFREYIKKEFDKNNDNALSADEISNIEKIDVSKNAEIKDLTGIERFTALQTLDCVKTGIKKLDVSGCGSLTTLKCYDNTELRSLDVSGLTKLEYLDCSNTGIEELDVSGLTDLTALNCSNTEITELDVIGLTKLENLDYSNTGIKELDVSKLTNLIGLNCSNTGIKELDVSGLTNLQSLYCFNTGITELDVSKLTNLMLLYCSNTGITELDISGLTSLMWLDCSGNALYYLKLPAGVKFGDEFLLIPEPTFSVTAPGGEIALDDLSEGIEETKVTVTRNGRLSGRKILVEDLTKPVVYRYDCGGTYKGSPVTLTVTLNIVKGDSVITIADNLDKIYDGSKVRAEVEKTGSANETVLTWYENTGTEGTPVWEQLKEAPSDAGSYKVVAKVEADEYCKEASAEKEFKITKAQNEWTSPLSIKGWTSGQYHETENAPAAKAKFGEAVFTYSKEKDGAYTTAVPQQAGTWYVKGTVAGTENYTGLEAIQAFTVAARPSSPEQKPEQKLPQTITAKSFTKTYGNKTFSLKARAKTALTYKSSDKKVAVVSGAGTVTLKGPGKATITITAAASGQYSGATKRITITVKPKRAALKSAKSTKKRTLKVTWKRDKKATGYQAAVAQNKSFKKGKKTALIKKNKTTSRTFKNLRSGKTYYYKVRAYKQVGKTKLYGAYSKVKKVRVK